MSISNQRRNEFNFQKLLEASQLAFESSEKALKAAEEALTTAKIANAEAEKALNVVTKAYKAASCCKTSEIHEKPTSSSFMSSVDSDLEMESPETDEPDGEGLIMQFPIENTVIDLDESPPFFIVSSSGPAADCWADMFGLYRKTEELSEGRSVYIQEHDTKYLASPYKLSSAKGVWSIGMLRSATASESPASVKWQYKDRETWRDDPLLTVTGLSEKPSSDCEVIISLSKNVVGDISKPSVSGVYRVDGSYCMGRPVLLHSGGRFTLSAGRAGCWRVTSDGVGGYGHLLSGSAPSLCPADPRAASNGSGGQTSWKYKNKQIGRTESKGIRIKCKEHKI